MRMGHKQYFMMYESDFIFCGNKDHIYGNASSIKTAKQYIKNCRQRFADEHPRNFRIFDSWADVDPTTDFVPCVYQED